MKTSIFTKLIDNHTLFVFEFNGELSSPYGHNSIQLRKGILTKNGFEEKKMNIPAGAFTKIESLDFTEAMAKTQENVSRLKNDWAEKREAEKKTASEKRAAKIAEMNTPAKGWYEVSVKYAVNDFIGGGHKWRTQEGNVLADSAYDAYLKAEKEIEKKEGFFIQEAEDAYVQFVGVLTDEYLNS